MYNTSNPIRGRVALVVSEWYNVEQTKKSSISAGFMCPLGGAIYISTRYAGDEIIQDQKMNFPMQEHDGQRNPTWKDSVKFGFK